SFAQVQRKLVRWIDAVAKAIAGFEAFTRCRDFKSFHIEQAKTFKRDLADQRGGRSGEPLLRHLRAPLPGQFSHIAWSKKARSCHSLSVDDPGMRKAGITLRLFGSSDNQLKIVPMERGCCFVAIKPN